ncbi:MAG: hypothetical protein NTV72_01940 [Candidatus Taylorbacteria bacterium]|nr:hypothetical protein [Candidatus Taylorbacteria bacterium]
MKLISINAQCGTKYEALLEFLKENSQSVDIFCLQEVFHNAKKIRPVLKDVRPNLFGEIEAVLTDFKGYFTPPQEDDVGGLAIFAKKGLEVSRVENIVIFPMIDVITDRSNPDFFTMGRDLQFLEFSKNGKIYSVLNFHGMWNVKGKVDTEKRLEQSEKIRKIFDELKGAKILCADMNILPSTKSLSILTEGNIDLIQKFGINSTRSASKQRPEVVDYIITSPEIEVLNFEVPSVEISDHLPLVLEFN